MRIEKLGKRAYAFGLSWVDNPDSVEDALRTALETETPDARYVAMRADSGRWHVGYTREEIKAKGKVASYAATLAHAAKDGIYVAPVEGGGWWYTVVSNGVVLAQTDQIIDEESVVDTVNGMRDTFETLAVYCYADALSLFDEAQEFDPVAIVEKAKPFWLKRTKAPASALKTMMALVMMLAVPVGLYITYEKMFGKPPVKRGPTPEEIRARYLSTVRQSIGTLPSRVDWVNDAFMKAKETFPPYRGGWALDRVACMATNGSCMASYSRQDDGVWTSPAELGASGSIDGRSASLAIAVPVQRVDPTDEEVFRWPVYGEPLAELVGVFPLRFAGIGYDRPPSIVRLDERLKERPPQAQPLFKEEVVLRTQTLVEPYVVSRVVAFWSAQGFRATSLQYATGAGVQNSGWRIELVRIGGQR